MFLDEIGDMPLALQAKMLRLLQEQAFERIGGNETVKTDVRLIAATHRDLTVWSAEGRFRPDLYYRLGVFTIHLPPLRERGDDLAMLVRHYLKRISRELGREVREIAPDALERLRSQPWPGNIRELQSALKQALLQASGTILLPAFLPESLVSGGVVSGEWSAGSAPLTTYHSPLTSLEAFIGERLVPEANDLYAETHRQVDRLLLLRVLEFTSGNQNQAARMLGIARQTLRVKLRDLGLSVAHSVEADPEDDKVTNNDSCRCHLVTLSPCHSPPVPRFPTPPARIRPNRRPRGPWPPSPSAARGSNWPAASGPIPPPPRRGSTRNPCG